MLTHWGRPPPNGLNERPKRRRSFDKDQRFRFLAELRQPIESGVRRRLNSDLAARLHGKQRSAMMYQALKAVRGHIQSCDIEGVFVSYAASEGIERIQRLFTVARFGRPKELPGRRQHGGETA
jgi:hypothetical protein